MLGKARHPYAALVAVGVCVYLAGAGAFSYWSVREHRQSIMDDIDGRLVAAARGVRHVLSPDFHDRALDSSSISKEESSRNRAAVSAYATDTGLECVYTLVERDGRFYFSAPTVADGELSKRESWYFYPYEDVPPEFVTALAGQSPIFSSYQNQRGTFRSVAVPQESPGGRPYLACADCDVGYVHGQMSHAWGRFVVTASVLLLLPLPFVVAYCAMTRRRTNDLLASNHKLRDDRDRLEGVVGQQAEDLKIAKESAEEANATKSRFLAGVSHQLRTLLNVIIGSSEIMRVSNDVADLHRHAERILSESEMLANLVDDLPTSDHPGHGTASLTNPAGDEAASTSPTVLIVEDYVPNQDIAKFHLERSGYTVEIAENGLEAYDLAVARRFDLILMDIQMPVMDGIEATRRIRSSQGPCSDVPVVGCTAQFESDTKAACIDAGMQEVIAKPIRRKAFIATVDQWLRWAIDSNPLSGSSATSEHCEEPIPSSVCERRT